MQVSIAFKNLLALTHLAAKKDRRYYITGVYLAPNGDTVATNGHMLGMIEGAAQWPTTANKGLIIPVGPINAMAKKLGKKLHDATIDIKHIDGLIWEMCYGASITERFEAIDGRYPDYQRVMPADTSDKHTAMPDGQFHWSHMMDFCKVAEIAGHVRGGVDGVYMWHRGNRVAYISIPSIEGFKGVLMGLRA